MPSTAPYGTWKSPIVADLITQKNVAIAEVYVDPITKTIYHSEGRPSEAGRNVPVNTKAGTDVFGKDWNARTGVHEYGGAALAVHNGAVYFTDFKSKRLYVIGKDGSPEAVSADNENHRFGDFVVHPTHPHLVVSILEDHTHPAPADVVTTLVAINTKTQALTTLAKGADFYSTPRFSPDGGMLSWIRWNHPNMPWEGSELVLAKLSVSGDDQVEVKEETAVAGKEGEESVTEAQWASDNALVFFSDKSGFYNPWTYDVRSKVANPILHSPADEEYAGPAWLLGMSSNAVMDASTLLVSPSKNGLALLDVNTGTLAKIQSQFVSVSSIRSVSDTQAVFVGQKDDAAAALILLTLPTPARSCLTSSTIEAQFGTLKATSDLASTLPPALFPIHQKITLGVGPNNAPLHVLYYPPTNPEYTGGKDNELPPCVLHIHGGPTSAVSPGLSWLTTYFTSRGWAWANVNYGGSSGYGRAYRDRLRGNWGVVDVNDSATAAEELGKKGLIDAKRVAIRGGSAGGFTVLAALVNKPASFATGTSSYGVSDLAMLASDTHKFESKYLDKLVGGTVAEVPEIYKERSPVHHADKITAPLLILQGSIDAVVPQSQAEAIVNKIKERGGKVEYRLFEGEGHGWRRAETVKEALETEEAFYKEVFRMN